MKQLLLIRHGITVANRQKRYCGWTDSPLCPEGIAALEEKKGSCRYPSLSGFAVYTSDLCRTEQTLSVLYGQVPHTREKDFREVHFGVFENRSYEQMKDDPLYQAWLTGSNEDNVCPEGESGSKMTRRVLQCLEQVMAAHSKVCIVTHGGVIAAIMANLFAKEGKNRFQWQPDNGCGYLICFDQQPRYIPVPFEKQNWEDRHFSFFQNTACEFFPCHRNLADDDFNCLFCYCPLYMLGENCGGQFTYTENGIKNCTQCLLPHRKNSYGYVVGRFQDMVQCMCKQHPEKPAKPEGE